VYLSHFIVYFKLISSSFSFYKHQHVELAMCLWQDLASIEEKLTYQVEQKTQDLQSQLDSCDVRVRISLLLLYYCLLVKLFKQTEDGLFAPTNDSMQYKMPL